MNNINESKGFTPTTETRLEHSAQETAPKPTESQLMQNENSRLETEIMDNEEKNNSLERSLALDDTRSEAPKIDPKIIDYFRDTLGIDETVRRLKQIGESGAQRIVKEIQGGNFHLVVHLMELNNPNNQWDAQTALDSISYDSSIRERGSRAIIGAMKNEMGIISSIEKRHDPEEDSRWNNLYNILGITKSEGQNKR